MELENLDEYTMKQLLYEDDKYPVLLEDLLIWKKDYEEVQKEVSTWFEHNFINIEEQFSWFIYKAHHNNAIDICSDTSEPLEYIDFNYGSITCTISAYNEKQEPMLLITFDGYIRRDGVELEGCFTDLNYDTICTIVENIQKRTVKELLNG